MFFTLVLRPGDGHAHSGAQRKRRRRFGNRDVANRFYYWTVAGCFSHEAGKYRTPDTMEGMLLVAVFFMRLIEIVFFAGIAGSAVVVVISFVEDVHELLGE